ncbi:protein kinase domain-containing protein [Sorangium sp. So ce381]|uniref:serine/threonine-protein kinase n=1 Tax=Sorangium sp. So ce381 TaxID=3133307 RepID=UPI003F5B4373
MRLRAGDRVDHYTLVKPLGEGGQGAVWKVIDPREGGVVRALKLVRLEEAGRQSFDRARREAKILASAKHPALVACHGFFEDMHAGLVGLVMDFVRGRSLGVAASDGQLDGQRALAALEQVASALAYVHGAGLVHRDLKPDNVLLADSFWSDPRRPGAVKLLDFGIAASAGNPRPLTSLGAVVGTIPYMAPELVDPATWGRAEGPSRDLFAFGIMAWEVLFHNHPTGLASSATLVDYARAYKAAQAGRIVWPPRGLAGPWGAAVEASLALSPLQRPANGAALLEILRTSAAHADPEAAGVPAAAGPLSPLLSAPTLPHQVATTPMTSPPVPAVAITQPEKVTPPRGAPVPARGAPVPATQPAKMTPPPIASVIITQPQDIFPSPAPPAHGLSPAGRRSGRRLATLAVVISVIGAATAWIAGGGTELLVSLVASREEPMAGSIPPLSPPSAASVTLPSTAPEPPQVPAASTPEIEACCSSHMVCKGPTKLRCPRCTGAAPPLPRAALWWLRLSSVFGPDAQDMTRSRPYSEVCMRIGDPPVCAPFFKIGSRNGDEVNRLAVTTEDVEDMRIQFSIDGSAYLPGRVKSPPVLVSALCGGLYVYIDGPDRDDIKLAVYLDPRTSEGP